MEAEIDKKLEIFYKEKGKCEIIHRLMPDKNGEVPCLSMENCYINLTVVKHIETEMDDVDEKCSKEKIEYGDVTQNFNRPRSSEELNLEEAGKNVFQIGDIFEKTDPPDVPKRILMLGRAGIGKTTLCKKIVYDHYVNGLWKEKFIRIIWLPLRIFKRESLQEMNSPTLSDVFELQYFSSGENLENFEMGQKLVEENEIADNKVLYLLDGLDEIQSLVGNLQFKPINKLLDELFGKPFVIVTSRPYVFYDNYNNFDFILETIGFSEENVLDYVRVVFPNPSEFQHQKEIIEFIEKSPGNISGIVSIPILLDIICYTWTDIKNMEQSTPFTMTRLYSVLEKYLWGQFLIRIKKIDVEQWRNSVKRKSEVYSLVNECVDANALPKIAYEMLAKNKIEFCTEEAMLPGDFGPKERILLKNTIFLHCLNPVEESIDEILKSYAFIHLTIQEYLAAVHIAKCFIENQQPEFENAIYHKYNPRYSIVWSFVSGILADSKEELQLSNNGLLLETFFNYLERDPTDELGIAHQHLIINCLNECSYPSILDSERENRLINELFSYIFTQYVAHGKSLFEQQLPVKLVMKLISTPEDWWAADAERFKIQILKEQYLPEEIVMIMLDDDNNNTELSNTNKKILKSQSHFGLNTIKSMSTLLFSKIKNEDTTSVLKYVDILNTKRFLPTDEEFFDTINMLIDFSATRAIKSQVLKMCLKLKEIPFRIIEKLVLNFAKEKKKRTRNINDEDWKEEIIMRIIRDKKFFPGDIMLQLLKQKCFSEILEDLIQRKINLENADIFYRLIFVISRRNVDENLIEKLLNLVTTPKVPFEVKRLSLYVIGNRNSLSESVTRGLIQILEQGNLPINLDFSRKLLMYSSEDGNRVPSMDFRHLVSIIPLMKNEFYDKYREKQSRYKFRRRIYFSDRQFDQKYFKFLSNDLTENISRCIKGLMRRDLNTELLETYQLLPIPHSEWLEQLDTDAYGFLKTLATYNETFFACQQPDTVSSYVRSAKYYKILVGDLLDEELQADAVLHWDILDKYKPLIVLSHKLYAEESMERERATYFEMICERVLLENLIVRALRDCDIPDTVVSHLETTLCEQIQPNGNRFVSNILKIFECKHLKETTISKIIDFIEIGNEYEVELTTSILGRQTITNPCDIEKLKEFLLEENAQGDNNVRKRNYRYVANVFETNASLLENVQKSLLLRMDSPDFDVKFKAMKVLRRTQFKEESDLLKLPAMIKYSWEHSSNVSHLLWKICNDTLLNQKKLPPSVLEKMADYFDSGECGYESFYLGLLNLVRMPLPRKCIESLFRAINEQFFRDVRELATKVRSSETLMFKILRKQPLWKLRESECQTNYVEINSHGRFEHNYTVKDKVIVEKILLDKMPMAIQKHNGKLCCFSPNSKGGFSLLDFGAIQIDGILQDLFPGINLNLPARLDKITKYLKFHSPDEDLLYIRQLQKNQSKNLEPCNNYPDYKILLDKNNFYIKIKKTGPVTNTQNMVKVLLENFELAEYRHIDLSDNDLKDSEICELQDKFLKLIAEDLMVTRIKTLILSDNNVTVQGLGTLLRYFKKYSVGVDYIFLDRNLIFTTVNEFSVHIDPNYQRPAQISTSVKKNNPNINAHLLDLSLNFISNGELIVGDPFANEEIQKKYQNDMKENITNSKQIHSQNLNNEIFLGDKFGQIISYCHSHCYPEEKKNITIQTGCIVIAEKYPKGCIGRWLFNRGHAFMVIEWIPDTEYGQRQIILAELRKNVQERNRLGINIYTISPSKLKKKMSNCASCRTLFETNEDIKHKLIPRLHRSRKQVDIFDYFVFSSKKDREQRGRFNCITWTDEMLKELGHNVDGMHKSRTRLYIIFSAAALSAGSLIAYAIYYSRR